VVEFWKDGVGNEYKTVTLAEYVGGGEWQLYDTSSQEFIKKEEITHWKIADIPEPPQDDEDDYSPFETQGGHE
jgi:hypothetical protein